MTKAASTRHHILSKAFELIYTRGFKSTSIDDILQTTEVTKGAFYYHFSSKDVMGLAIIDEVLKPVMQEAFLKPLDSKTDPVDLFYVMIRHLLLENEFLKPEYGCPVNNLTQEMSPWHIEFSNALSGIISQWELHITNWISMGKKSGFIDKKVKGNQVAIFILSGYWGVRNLGKLKNNDACYHDFLKSLKSYLEGLR